MEIEKEAETILKKFSDVLETIPDLEETQYLVDNLNRTREDVKSPSNPEKILRNTHLDKKGSIIAEKGKWTK
ncbi:MAG: Asp-tRNA(Asn) amidotransferase subunit GatC [Methanosphaera stadtmanae]|nr:Asp-tRNA(Asn) amidotransferase subunit GatC [Methanosphaera stadtmanae]